MTSPCPDRVALRSARPRPTCCCGGRRPLAGNSSGQLCHTAMPMQRHMRAPLRSVCRSCAGATLVPRQMKKTGPAMNRTGFEIEPKALPLVNAPRTLPPRTAQRFFASLPRALKQLALRLPSPPEPRLLFSRSAAPTQWAAAHLSGERVPCATAEQRQAGGGALRTA